MQAELDKPQAATVNAEKFMGIVRKYLAFEELTPAHLREMIEKIVVHKCSYDENGTSRQNIEIYYSFAGKIFYTSIASLSYISKGTGRISTGFPARQVIWKPCPGWGVQSYRLP